MTTHPRDWLIPPHPGSSNHLFNAAPDLLDALLSVRAIITEAAMTGFNWKDGDWAERLFKSQQKTSAAIKKAQGKMLTGDKRG